MQTPAPNLGLPFDVTSWDRLHRPIWLFDPASCRGLYANASALLLWDADSLEELLARDFSKLSTAVRTRVERLAAATTQGRTVSERWSFYPKGKPVTVQAMISSLDLGDGRVALQFEASPVDVEEGELRTVEALRHTSSLITLFDADGFASFTNPAAFAAYGEDGHSFVERFSDAIHGATALMMVLDGRVLSELRQVRTLHGERWHYLDARSVTDPVTGQTCVLLSERDVTAQVEAERALTVAEERAEVAETKQRFLANMSHELRTPLNAVLGFAGLLGATALDAAQAGHLARISEAGRALSGLVNDVIDMAELDDGAVVLDPAPFALQAMVEDAFAPHEAAAEAKGLEIALNLVGEVPGCFVGDAPRLAKVLSHFISNAVKFTERGGIEIRVGGQPRADGRFALEIGIVDSGPGMDEAAQTRLFRRFAPGDDSTHKRASGVGLGLSVSKELAALMDGEVGAESTPSHGSTFWIRVPLPVHDAVAEDDLAEDTHRPLTILYADDHENNRALIQALLQSQGHRCDTVDDGAQAVQAVRDGFYDLVLMDIQMPVQDGVSATLAIRAGGGLSATVPILALTANTLSDQLTTYEAAGMNDCIAKPVEMADLFAKVNRWAAADADRPAAGAAA